jgi:uncharacterized protein YkwD
VKRCLTPILAVAMTALALPAAVGASGTRPHGASVHVRHQTIHRDPRKGSKHPRKGRHKHKRKHHGHRHAVRRVPTRPATASGYCPGANLTPKPGNVESVVAATLCLINGERSRFGEPALIEDARLASAASGHSRDMDARDYFEHVSPGGQTLLMRVRASGFIPGGNVGYTLGENIAWGTLWLASPHAIVKAWMDSPGHRANILNRSYRYTGIGVDTDLPHALSGGRDGGMYTQDFGTILS